MIGGMGCPQYIRAINFTNEAEDSVVAKVTCQSGNVAEYTVNASETIKVEVEIDHGSWQACDPIEKVVLND